MKQKMIEQAKAYAKKTGKPMQVVWSDHGGYQVFPAKFGCSIGFRQVFSTEDDNA